jgi:hypothetical protein
VFDESGDVRWGDFLVTGTFDGTTFTVSAAVPGALYDPAAPPPAPTPCESLPNVDCSGPSQQRIARIRAEVEQLPGVLTIDATRYVVHADVVYDDGSLQAWADEEYGAGVVEITGALVDRVSQEGSS